MRHGVRTALLVDDEAVNRMAMARLLRLVGATRVAEAGDGAEALQQTESGPFDLIICDIDMQPMDGFSFVRALRRAEASPNRQTPVVMLSKYSASSVLRAAREAGAAAYIVKPVSRDDLTEMLARVVPAPDAAPEAAPDAAPEAADEGA